MSDWTSFVRKIRIQASKVQVFNAWTHTDAISKWFLKKAEILGTERTIASSGDHVEWEWNNYPHPMQVEYKRVEENNTVVFTFGEGMEVEIGLVHDGDFTVLTLRQYNIPTSDDARMNFYVGCGQAWSSWLMNLKCWLEHDLVLHDTSLGNREDLFDFVNT